MWWEQSLGDWMIEGVFHLNFIKLSLDAFLSIAYVFLLPSLLFYFYILSSSLASQLKCFCFISLVVCCSWGLISTLSSNFLNWFRGQVYSNFVGLVHMFLCFLKVSTHFLCKVAVFIIKKCGEFFFSRGRFLHLASHSIVWSNLWLHVILAWPCVPHLMKWPAAWPHYFQIGSFFCAIEPEMRLQWASRIRDLLKPDGELVTLIFPVCQ